MKFGKWATFSSVFVILLFSNCAGTYKSFQLSTIPFKETVTTDNKVAYSTRQGVMYNTKNYKYAKQEQRGSYSIMAVKIVNNSDLPVPVNYLNFSCGGSTNVSPIPMNDYLEHVHQKAGLYWLYAAGVVPNPFCKGCLKYVIPWGIVPAATNFGIAVKANKKMRKELALYDITGKIIQAGDSITGILPFKGINNCGEIYITVRQ